MRFPIRIRTLLLGAAALGTLACDSTTAPETRTTDQLHFVRARATAPPLVVTSTSFYAKRGENREASIWYHPELGSADSVRFLLFKVPDDGLLSRPDGTLIAVGDSVLITITVTDVTHMVVDFQPSGLRFRPGKLAELELDFAESDDDRDGDGDVDSADAQASLSLALWRQEALNQPWYKVPATLELSLEKMRAEIGGFTGYAIAY